MTGTGTKTDPYIVDNWQEFEAAVELVQSATQTTPAYIHFNPNASNKIVDMRKIHPSGCPTYNIGSTNLIGNGWEIRNLYLTNSLIKVSPGGAVIGFNFTKFSYHGNYPFIHAISNGVSGVVPIENNVFSGVVESSDPENTFGFIGGEKQNSYNIQISIYNNTFDLKAYGNGLFILANDVRNQYPYDLYPVAFNDIKIHLSGSTFIHENTGIFGNCYQNIIHDNRIEIETDTGCNFRIETNGVSKITRNVVTGSNSGQITQQGTYKASYINVYNSDNLNLSGATCNFKPCTTEQLRNSDYLTGIKFTTRSENSTPSLIVNTLSASDFESGNIGSKGNVADNNTIRTGYIEIDSLPICVDRITVTAIDVDNNPISVDFRLYSSNTSTSPLISLSDKNSGEPFGNTNAVNLTKQYYRIVLKHTDGSPLTLDKIQSCTVSLKTGYWYIDENNQLTNIAFISIPQKPEINIYPEPQPEAIRVYDMEEPQDGFEHNGIAILTPIKAEINEEADGVYDYTMVHPIDAEKRWEKLLECNVIKSRAGQLFRIYRRELSMGEGNATVTVAAKHISYDLNDRLILPCKIEGDGQQFIDKAESFLIEDTQYNTYEFDIKSDIKDKVKADYSYISLNSVLFGADNSLASIANGELYRDNFHVSINKRREGARDNAFDIRYSVDMTKIRMTVDYSDLCTWLIAEDNFMSHWEISHAAPECRFHHHIVKYIKFNYNEFDLNQLIADAQRYFNRYWLPNISFVVEFATLKNDPKYAEFTNLQNCNVGDTGHIYCEPLKIDVTLKIVAKKINDITGETISVTVNNMHNSFVRQNYMGNTISSGNSAADKQMAALRQELRNTRLKMLTTWRSAAVFTWGEASQFTWREVKKNG